MSRNALPPDVAAAMRGSRSRMTAEITYSTVTTSNAIAGCHASSRPAIAGTATRFKFRPVEFIAIAFAS